MESHLLGLNIDPNHCAAIVGDAMGNIVARREIPTESAERTIANLLEVAREMIRGLDCRACGISSVGPLSSRDGVILSPPNLPGWDAVPVVQLARDTLGITVGLENDANAAALAEWRWGLGQRVDDLIYLTCDKGLGAGIVLGGRLHRGRQDLAGEIGHIRLLPLGPVGYRKAGSIEGLASGLGMVELARLRLAEPHPHSALDRAHRDGLEPMAVVDAALGGDLFAIAVVTESSGHLGRVCAMLLDLLNPQRISLGNLAVRLGPLALDEVRRCAQAEALPAAFEACDIDLAALGLGAQDVAALAVASLVAEDLAAAIDLPSVPFEPAPPPRSDPDDLGAPRS